MLHPAILLSHRYRRARGRFADGRVHGAAGFAARARAARWMVVFGLAALGTSAKAADVPQGRAEAGPPPADFHPTRLLVRFAQLSEEGAAGVRRIRKADRVVATYRRVPGLGLVRVPEGELAAALAEYQARSDVLYAERDYQVQFTAEPDDPAFPLQWGLRNTGQVVNGDPGLPGADTGATHAWDVWRGSPTYRIAIIDTGIDLGDSDLEANIWVNEGEVPGNGIDDDGNGWVDDVHGYNTLAENGDVADSVGHGTQLAGVIGAATDNSLGMAGLNWETRLVSVKFADDPEEAFVSDAIQGLGYAVDTGITLSNNSWGCYACYSQALYDAIEASQSIGHIFVTGAGNGFLGLGLDAAEYPFYPASYDLPNIIAVAASDSDDEKTKFSNFGADSIDLAAPGMNVYTTGLGSTYVFGTGTSYSAAYVTGAVGLLRGRRPDLSWQQVRDRVLAGVRKVDSFSGLTVSGGVLDVAWVGGDCNRNGVLDDEELAGGASDCDGNGVPDECEPDCNGNGIVDACDVFGGTSTDCNDDLVPDECEPDCNGNGIADACDVISGLSDDCNRNGVPDDCEAGASVDCNANGIADLCDLHAGTSFDCNQNRRPDECDINRHTSEDCTGNGLPDECERDCNENAIADSCDIADERSQDADLDGVPDECVLGFRVVPVDATGDFDIVGREIFILEGAQRVTLEVRVSGWDPDQDGEPLLGLYQVSLDESGFTSGERGSLTFSRIPCTTNDDCLATAVCLPSGFCDEEGAINIDERHEAFVFGGVPTISSSDPVGARVGSLVFDAEDHVRDMGGRPYTMTFILAVSVDAWGTFTIGVNPAESLLKAGASYEIDIPIRGFLPAKITILPDCNQNGVLDSNDILNGTSSDCNDDGSPDECVAEENDCNGNMMPDICDTRDGTSPDCNANSIPDECIALEADCNENGVPDSCDSANGTSSDCNGNNIPDECLYLETDCNANSVPDACDIADGTSDDCNANLRPDDCEPDCNGNGIADSCDIEDGRSLDRDENATPDECQRLLRVPSEYPTLRSAIDSASAGDVVLVADGTYTGEGNVDVSFRGKAIAVRSEGGPSSCTVDAAGAAQAFVFSNRENTRSRLEGFTITGGRTCGILCVGTSPVIEDCVITGNGPGAGGIYCLRGGRATIRRCTITRNSAGFSGGGVVCDESSPMIIESLISENIAGDGGGGIFAYLSAIEVSESTIVDNIASTEGGGLYLIGGSPLVRNCYIHRNFVLTSGGSLGDGGGLHLFSTNATVANCLITGNDARRYGGGVYIQAGDPLITNCTITGNRAFSGGGLYRFGGQGETFACCNQFRCDNRYTRAGCDNVAGTFYPGLRCNEIECGTQSCCLEDGTCRNLEVVDCQVAGGLPMGIGSQCSTVDCTPNVTNSILWNNGAASGPNVGITPVRTSVAHSTVGGGWPGEGNDPGPPGFVVAGAYEDGEWVDGDYHMRPGAFEVDSGDQVHVPPVVQTDFDGHARVLCGQVDRGIYERGIGDADCDGVVELGDFGQWVTCMTGVGSAAIADSCRPFDFNGDADVDVQDYARFQSILAEYAP